MSHIAEFTIKGLAGRKKPMHCKLDRHLNVFYGLNGSGKTSLIKILHSAMSGDPSSIQNVPFLSATVKIYSIDYDKIFTRKITRGKEQPSSEIEVSAEIESRLEVQEFVQLGSPQEESPKFRWTEEPQIQEGERAKTTRWRHRYLPTTRLHVVEDMKHPYSRRLRERELLLTEEQLDAVFAESVERLWSRYSSDLLVAVRHAQEEGLARILESILAPTERIRKGGSSTPVAEEAYACLKNFINRQGSKTLLGDYRTFKKRYNQEPNFQLMVADIHKVESVIQQVMTPRDKLQSLIERLYTGEKHIDFGDRSITVKDAQGNPISLASLSSGEKHLMRILVETLLAENSSIMIDEPEISMHIDWQRELLATMSTLNPHAQFVVATHSPEIMANVPDERIILL
ncbi:MAG: AAA family ATPase [Desulfobaccales bacterium]